MAVRRVALIYDHRARPYGAGAYCRGALGELAEVEHFLPDELNRIPRRGFDLYLNVDDGLDYTLPPGLGPTAWWAVDTHRDYERCLHKSAGVDFVFAAQRDGAERLKADGVDSAAWLPLACDPRLHARQGLKERYDVAFVGPLPPGPRAELVETIRARWPKAFVGQRHFDESARVYSQSRVVFNRSLKNDVNMRVFEALASGSLLVTNDLEENGLNELFVPGVHLATYREPDELIATIERYLADDAERRLVGARGRQEALANHTYRRRMEDVLSAVAGEPPGLLPRGGAAPRPRPVRWGRDPSYFGQVRPEVAALVPESAATILDVGCGAGGLGAFLKERQECEVVGIEVDGAAAEAAKGALDRVLEGDVERLEPDFGPARFDAVVCADVLEHLREPAALLRRARHWLKPGGVLALSVPNARHRSVAGALLAGNWTYGATPLPDRGQWQFFTRREVEKLLFRAGFAVRELRFAPGDDDGDWLNNGRPATADVGPVRLTGLSQTEAEEFHAARYLIAAVPADLPERPTTSVVVVTRDRLDAVRRCVDGLLRLTDEPTELIFVDNGSVDGTPDFLATVPGAVVIRNAEDAGFAAAANRGLRAASGRFLMLLDDGAVVTTGWLERLHRAFDRGPGVGLVGPGSNGAGGAQWVPAGYRGAGDLDGFAWDWGRTYDGLSEPVDRLDPFCLMVRREAFDAAGPLDEGADAPRAVDDYCRRSRAAGWGAAVARDAFVHLPAPPPRGAGPSGADALLQLGSKDLARPAAGP